MVTELPAKNFKDLFYGELPKVIEDISTKTYETIKDSGLQSYFDLNLIDAITIAKWIKTFYRNTPSSKFIQNSKNLNDDFTEYCEIHDVKIIQQTCSSILSNIRFFELAKYFDIVSRKNSYNKYHFRNSKYIQRIRNEIVTLISLQNSENFHFNVKDAKFLEVDQNYFWNKYGISFQNDIDTIYELRRFYDSSKDHIIFSQTFLEKKVCEIRIINNVLYLLDEMLIDSHVFFSIVLKLISSLIDAGEIFDIDYKTLHKNNYFYTTFIVEELKTYAPLKLYADNDSDLFYQLKEHFKDVKSIDTDNYAIHFKIDKLSLYRLFDYVYHDLDEKTFYTIIANQKVIQFKANDIWTDLIDFDYLTKFFDFEISDKKIEFFRNSYVNDYFLTDSINDIETIYNSNFLIKILTNAFDLVKIESDYCLDLLPYISKILKIRNFDYFLPYTGFDILTEYFKNFEKKSIPSLIEFNCDWGVNFHFTKNEVTSNLIKHILVQYQKEDITNEMRNI